MKVLFRFDASDALAVKVAALSGDGIEVACCPESEDRSYQRSLPGIEVLWHVLKPVTAAHIERASRLQLIQKIGSGVNTSTWKRRSAAASRYATSPAPTAAPSPRWRCC